MKDNLLTVKDITDYFRRYARVRDIKITENVYTMHTKIEIKSWILLNKWMVMSISKCKPACLIFEIYNKSIFGYREYKL